ncbi:hypothetical protein CEY16_10690 [Halalkalibacillus sediminis]|uniref:Gram-positive cocci surface proteins LPxTG domain-containing protein n=1 Tax=Halalkalibacillus sediminis TaxID=2018042 RepID=A0A2I0QSB4_9BACI|nr:TasA family protein [Halalkalibacillus sediminis]PKR77199.1 hypothetical protein CEY16_10690 [Halalkalibacillus sediminis]
MKRFIFFVAFLYTSFALIFILPGLESSAFEQDSVSLITSPTEVLFDITNMKPGDRVERNISINNDGAKDYYYQSKAEQTSGSKKLYNEFQLTVINDGETLFEGSLGDFFGFEPRQLASGESEELLFVAEFPYESGNEFQGLEMDFLIEIWADGEPIEPVVSDNSDKPSFNGFLPQTGEESSIIYFIIGGLAIALGGTIYFKARRKDVG